MSDDRTRSLLAHLTELEARDLVLAERLEAIDALTARTAELRVRGAEIEAALAAHPAEVEAAHAAEAAGRRDVAAAAAALAEVETRVASFGRRTSQSERDQAERELVRAREDVHDAGVRVTRAQERLAALADELAALGAAGEGVVVEASRVAAEIGAQEIVAAAGKVQPGTTLASVEDWGARARAALFVARGTLATERERVVIEANTLGSSVLREPLGGSSVTLVRRRVESELD